MQKNTSLVITSIADDKNKVLGQYAALCKEKGISFILIGDRKSPDNFSLAGCDFYAVDAQQKLNLALAKIIPENHYARKNLGYLIAMQNGSEVIVETDDDNIPYASFWQRIRKKQVPAYFLEHKSWVNIYKYFSDKNIWPRGFALQKLQEPLPELSKYDTLLCPIQQGLADEDPDVDAIYRLSMPLPVQFKKRESIALGKNTICPFNSQNTTWFKEAFPLLYLPFYCPFRMTDIWRSFVVQRVAWEYDWFVLYHNATVWQERNQHDFMADFKDEMQGYLHNLEIVERLKNLQLKKDKDSICENMMQCYEVFIQMGLIDKEEIQLLEAWFQDISQIK